MQSKPGRLRHLTTAEFFRQPKATFTALTTAAKKAGSGTFVAGKVAAAGELVEAVDE